MSAGERSHGQTGCGADAGAYVLGALTSEEAEAFRRHLSTCVVCRDEVEALRTAVDALPLAAPQLPAPRRLRRRVLAGVHSQAKAGGDTGRRRVRPVLVRPAAVLASALVLVGAVVGALVLTSGRSDGTRVTHATVAFPGGSAVVRLADGHAELVVGHMPQPPRGKIYEVWLKREGHNPSPTSALFDVTSAGAAVVGLPGDLRGVAEVLVTPERRGGSLVPTHAPVIVAPLS
jgi:anti-sigma-K factor RskA